MIQISWSAPSSNGGVAIDTYKIFWDNNSGSTDLSTFIEIGTKSASDSLIFSKSSELTPGYNYQFAVTAINQVGTSDCSDTITVMAASAPSAPSSFSTDAQSTTSITISWVEPDDGGTSITDYEIDWNQGSQVDTWQPLVGTTSG